MIKSKKKSKLFSNRKTLIAPFICSVLFIFSVQRIIAPRDAEAVKKQVHVRPIMKVTKGDTTWTPKDPWDEPPTGFFQENDTGSFENCTSSFTPIKTHTKFNDDDNAFQRGDIGKVVISCHEILYRAPFKTIQNAGKVVIGLLSAASSYGPSRRNYIRSTWARRYPGIFFLVAGPWEDIKDEYAYYQDMIWIDEEEIYKGEDSVLTYKTMSFFAIIERLAKSVKDGGFEYALKSDDDSYIQIENVYNKLYHNPKEEDKLHYFGQCPQFQVLPSRDPDNKWSVSYKTYPEPKLPLYCQGAGFGLSRDVISRAVQHLPHVRYQPFEDASIGMLVERSGFKPTMVAGVRVFRADTPKDRKCVNLSIPMSECYKDDPNGWPPKPPNMKKILIQHRVETKEDAVNIHKSAGLTPDWVTVIPKNFKINDKSITKRIQIKIDEGRQWVEMNKWAQ
jgi:hypothetical protein